MIYQYAFFILFVLSVGAVVTALYVNSFEPEYSCPDDVVWNTSLEGRI